MELESIISDCKHCKRCRRKSNNEAKRARLLYETHIENRLNAKVVLRDAMGTVFQYLNMRDLSRLAQVCKAWNDEVQIELQKRYLDLIVLPTINSEELLYEHSYHISKVLTHKPGITILFSGTSRKGHNFREHLDLELDTLKEFSRQFPCEVLSIGVFEAMLDCDLIHSLPLKENNAFDPEYMPCGTLCLSIPLNRRLTFKHACLNTSELSRTVDPRLIKKFVNDLEPRKSKNFSCILVFFSSPEDYYSMKKPNNCAKVLMRLLRRSYRKNKFALWGFVSPFKYFRFTRVKKKKKYSESKIEALVLSGPNLEAWSTTIPITLNQKEMDEKLRHFKDGIKLKKCSLGFICAPAVTVQPKGVVGYTENFDLMKRIKEILPNIKFFGAFGDDKHSYFGYDSSNQDATPESRDDIISIMVLTYS